MPFNTEINFENFKIGIGKTCFIVAEIGINHNGDIELAKETINAAKNAGANAVKFQNYETQDFIKDKHQIIRYVSNGKTITETQWDLFNRCELQPDALVDLKCHCDDQSIIFLSTPTSKRGIDALLDLNVCMLKNGSDFLTNLDFVEDLASTGLPVVLSTGMSTLSEIEDSVNIMLRCDNPNLVLLHCTSNYPTNRQNLNLRRIANLADTFGCITGFSDHSIGTSASIIARTLGASFIEKHFTLSKALPGPDHSFSCDPSELKQLVDDIHGVDESLGAAKLGFDKAERESRENFRLSCVAARDLKRGEVLGTADITYSRPGTGIPPKDKKYVVGCVLARDIDKGQVFTLPDIRKHE